MVIIRILSATVCLLSVLPCAAGTDCALRVVRELPPSADNCRNSEGDFARLRDGRVLYIYTRFRAGDAADHVVADLAGLVSPDGLSWPGEPRIVVTNDAAQNVMSVSLLRRRRDDLALFYLKKNSDSDCRPVLRVSSDEGRTWSAARQIVPDAEADYYVLCNARAVMTKTGRILLPLSVCRHSSAADGTAFCWYSDDDGETWRKGSGAAVAKNASGERVALQEPGLVELRDGSILLYARTMAGCQWKSISRDGGDTWSPTERWNLVSPCSPALVKRLSNGSLVAIWNDHESFPEYAKKGPPWSGGVRSPLMLAISTDEGASWPVRRILESDPAGWFCYTAALEKDGWLIRGYCSRDFLRHSRVAVVPSFWLASDGGNAQEGKRR